MESFSNTMTLQKGHSQQKLASQMPRGTRIDSTGTRLEVKGSRNYTSLPMYVGKDEIFDDIVIRGIRSDGFSSKLGVKNNKTGISKLISDLFEGDPRQQAVIAHFNSKRQRSNSAKTVFATMTQDELKLIHSELIPSKVDIKIRHRLHEAFPEEDEKLKHCAEVLQHLQTSFANLGDDTELLSIHNFQSRGFFSDVITSIANFLMQVVDDTNNPTQPTSRLVQNQEKENACRLFDEGKEDKTAAEILLSVGAGKAHHASAAQLTARFDSIKPNQFVGEGKEWVQLAMINDENQSKSHLKERGQENETFNPQAWQDVLENSKVPSNIFHDGQVVKTHSLNMTQEESRITTLEIAIDDGTFTDFPSVKRPGDDSNDEVALKRSKT